MDYRLWIVEASGNRGFLNKCSTMSAQITNMPKLEYARHDMSFEELGDLVSQAQLGDNEARLRLLEKYEPLLRTQVRGMHQRLLWSGTTDDVDDYIQQVRVAFLELVEDFDPSRGVPFGIYLMKMLQWDTVNFVRDERLRLGREMNYDHHVLQQILGGQESSDLDPEVRVLLREAADQLTPHQRKVFDLHYLQGKTTTEVGKMIGVCAREVRRVRERANKRLREYYG